MLYSSPQNATLSTAQLDTRDIANIHSAMVRMLERAPAPMECALTQAMEAIALESDYQTRAAPIDAPLSPRLLELALSR